MFQGVSARVLTMPTNALFAFLTAHTVIVGFGTQAYSQYGLLVSVLSMLPFLDLGLGAIIVNAIGSSEHPRQDVHVRHVIARVLKLLIVVAFILLMVGAAVQVFGLWHLLLGQAAADEGFAIAATVCWLAFSISLPAGIGSRILLGLGKNHVNIVCQSVQPPLTCLVVWITSIVSAEPYWPPIIFFLSLLTANCLTLIVAGRQLDRGSVRQIAQGVFLRSQGSIRVFHTAAPMLVIMIAAPLALQSDRVVLGHVSSFAAVAEYNLASQLFTPVWSVIATLSVSLWPFFMRKKADNLSLRDSVFRAGAGMSIVSLVGASATAAAAPWLAGIISDNSIAISQSTLYGFVAFLFVQAVQHPLGYSMMDPRGLKFQAVCSIPLVAVSLTLSIATAPSMGAAGPLFSSAVAVVLCQIIPETVYIVCSERVSPPKCKSSLVPTASVRKE